MTQHDHVRRMSTALAHPQQALKAARLEGRAVKGLDLEAAFLCHLARLLD